MSHLLDHRPTPTYFREKIGDKEYQLEEVALDVFEEVALWSRNPRLRPFMAERPAESEEDMEQIFRRTRGYDGLRKSIEDIGQLEHIYVWKTADMQKYLALEGGTRVTIKRELSLKYAGNPKEGQLRKVKAKILPPEFSELDRVVLLARIHVRGSGVRDWGRFIEAEFIYENTTPLNGRSAVMGISEMARYMGKSISWVSRLKDAYEFVGQYVDYLDSPDARRKAVGHFSILEEIIKSSKFGPRLKGDTPEAEALRHEVFEMVGHDVFMEYRDARHMREYFDDPEKWQRLKTLERHVANQLANEVRAAGPTTLKGKISGLYGQVQRALDRDPDALDQDDLEELQRCADLLASKVAADVGPFRLKLQTFIKALSNVTLEEIKRVTPEEFQALMEGMDDFTARLRKHTSWSNYN